MEPQLLKPTKEQYDLLRAMNRDDRVAVCKGNDALFSMYYFPHSKDYQFADFHLQFFFSFQQLISKEIDELVLLGFRECAKTALTKEFVIKNICYHLEDYIVWDSYDGGNSRRALFDIVVELQTNRRIIEDFGELYTAKRSMDEVTQKSVSDFVTNPIRNKDGTIKERGIRLEAHTTQESARGFNHGNKRPGIVILDDFENKKTIRSEAITLSIWEHIQELKGGVDSTDSKVVYLGNYISQFGNIQKIIDKSKVVKGMKVFVVPVMIDNKPTWDSKYVLTDAEADQFKLEHPHKKPRVSLEKKKRDLWTTDTGDLDWECEMMQNPIDNTLAKFKREYFKYIGLEEVVRKDVACFVIFDPALSEKDKSDDTGCAIIWVDKLNNWYSKVFKLRLNSKDMVDFIFTINDALVALGTPPRKIGFEKEKYYGAVFPFLKEKMREKNQFLPMFAIDIKGRGKEDRITNALQYRYESGVIFHVLGDMLGGIVPMTMSDYETQAQRFPAGGHDDMLDAHAYGADIVRFDAEESQAEKKKRDSPYNLDNFVDRIQRKAKEAKQYEDEIEEARRYGIDESQYQQDLPDEYFDEIGG